MKQKIILIAIAAAVVGVFVTGIANWEKTKAWARHYFYQGRSTVVRATDFSTQPLNDVQAAAQCRANLRTIENAKRNAAQAKGMATGRLTDKDVVAQLPGRKMPRCPAGGEYILGDIGTMPKCTIGSNKTVRTEDDHIVINY
jgi:hypothetical protein